MDLNLIREELKLTPAEFARQLGVSRGHGHDLLSGRRPLTIRTAKKLQALTDHEVLSEVIAQAVAAA